MVGSIGVGFFASPAADPALTSKQMHGLLYGGGWALLRAQLIGKPTGLLVHSHSM